MKLNPNLIEHENFHKGYWLKTQDCPWFFFYETPRKYKIPKKKEFYNTLDSDIKKLVSFLHSKNIPTTPSCSGHIEKDSHYDRIFNSIVKTSEKIKKEGIELENPETDKKFYYFNPTYKLPIDKTYFIENLREYQKKGVLGFVDNLGLSEKLSDTLPIMTDNNVTLIFTKGNSEKQITQNWKWIEKILKHLLR